jgi:hypothetical protein
MAHDEDPPFLKRAIGLSAGLHLLLVPLFVVPVLTGSGQFAGEASPALQRAQPITLTIEHRPPIQPRRAVAIARATPAPPQPRRPEIVAPRVVRDAPLQGERSEPSRTEIRAPRASGEAAPATPREALAAPQPVRPPGDLAQATPAPTPSAPPTPAAVAAAQEKSPPERSSDAAAGGWGQNFDSPMLADPSDLAELKAKYHVAKITIQVDENGRAVRVVMPSGVPDDARDDIVQRLSALHYVPAECNGLRCAGTLTVTL